MNKCDEYFLKQCGVCGKSFYCLNPVAYTYSITSKGRKHYYCCYTCYLKGKEQINKKEYRRRYK